LCGIGAVRTKEMEEHPTIIQTIEVHQRLSDLVRSPEGLRVTIRRSKSDQESVGVTIAIPAGRRL